MGYSGSAHRNLQPSRRMSMPRSSQFNSASLGSQSKPTIGYLEPEFTEADNSNTVFIQHHGSAGSNGMQNSGSGSNYGMPNSGSASNHGMQNSGSVSNYGMQNSGSASNYGMQNSGSASNHGMHNGGSTSNYGMHNSGSSSNYGMQNHASSGSNGILNQGSFSKGMQGMSHGSSSNRVETMRYESAGYY